MLIPDSLVVLIAKKIVHYHVNGYFNRRPLEQQSYKMSNYFKVWQRQRLIVLKTKVDCFKDNELLFVPNFLSFNVGDYIDILITVHVKRLHMNYDNLFMFQSHPGSFMQVFRTGGKINEQTLPPHARTKESCLN